MKNWKVGDRVLIPHWIKITKRQGRVNEIVYVDPPDRREPCLVLVKILRNGKTSKDVRARRWMRLKDARHLDKIET